MQKGFAHILILLLVLLGIIIGVYLVKHPTIFRPKADLGSRIEITGAGVSSDQSKTTSSIVNLILHYVPPAASSSSTLVNPHDNYQPNPPYYATIFYPWYTTQANDGYWSNWNDDGHSPPDNWHSHFKPQLGIYSSSDDQVINTQITEMAQAHINVALSSWWGQGDKTDRVFSHIVKDVMNRDNNPYPHLRWAVYDEKDGPGFADPSVSDLVSDINYIKSNYAVENSYLKVSGKPVIFVYADPNDGADYVNRWSQARQQTGVYVVLKVFSGFEGYASMVDGWHQYAPAERTDQQGSYSFSVSPGFYYIGDDSPRLARDTSAFDSAVSSLVSSSVTWKLITTWNEWGEGTGVEPATPVIQTKSGPATVDSSAPEFGNKYIEVLQNRLPGIDVGLSSPSPTSPPVPTDLRYANCHDTSSCQTTLADDSKNHHQSFSPDLMINNWDITTGDGTGGNGSKTVGLQFKVNGIWEDPIVATIDLEIPTSNSSPSTQSASSSASPTTIPSTTPSPTPRPTTVPSATSSPTPILTPVASSLPSSIYNNPTRVQQDSSSVVSYQGSFTTPKNTTYQITQAPTPNNTGSLPTINNPSSSSQSKSVLQPILRPASSSLPSLSTELPTQQNPVKDVPVLGGIINVITSANNNLVNAAGSIFKRFAR